MNPRKWPNVKVVLNHRFYFSMNLPLNSYRGVSFSVVSSEDSNNNLVMILSLTTLFLS